VILSRRIERGRESSRHTTRGEERSEGGGQLGPGPANPNLKVGATLSGAAQATAAPPSVAPHLPRRAPLSLRGSHCRATGSGAAPTSATPPWITRLKRVILIKLFRWWFIFYDCIKFRLILSKLPNGMRRIRRLPSLSPYRCWLPLALKDEAPLFQSPPPAQVVGEHKMHPISLPRVTLEHSPVLKVVGFQYQKVCHPLRCFTFGHWSILMVVAAWGLGRDRRRRRRPRARGAHRGGDAGGRPLSVRPLSLRNCTRFPHILVVVI
jgi:hypothetical protein